MSSPTSGEQNRLPSCPRTAAPSTTQGGFVGGRRDLFLELAETIAATIDRDEEAGLVALWHDESHLNRALIDSPPFLNLTPSYCYPDDDSQLPRPWRDRLSAPARRPRQVRRRQMGDFAALDARFDRL